MYSAIDHYICVSSVVVSSKWCSNERNHVCFDGYPYKTIRVLC